jgi:CBS domain-containing protein
MRTIDVVRRSGVGIGPEETIRRAASIMESAGVGSLAVVDGDRLVGIVTDRDLVRRCLARGVASDARIDSVMTVPVITVDADADIRVAMETLRDNTIRRLAVVRGNQFVGMITVDDLLIGVTADLTNLTRPVMSEVFFAQRDSGVPATVR